MVFKRKIAHILFFFLLFFSAFFKPLLASNTLQEALDKKLYESIAWQNLLHIKSNHASYINDSNFLLSSQDFSPKNELEKTVELFSKNPKNICQFPARFLWLSKHLDFDKNKYNLKQCEDFQNYLEQMPTQTISLVFVSQEVSSLSSMMGHAFFKLQSQNPNQITKAITFYPDIQTNNIPSLAFNSTLFELKGNFIIQDYKKQEKEYLQKENRNIWEYELELTSYQKELLIYHFWEVSHTALPYNFIHYNCGTLMNIFLNIALDSVDTHFNPWITPKDVAIRVYRQNLITKTSLTPFKQWELYNNQLKVSKTSEQSIVNAINRQDINELKQLINNKENNVLFALSYAEYLYYKTNQKTQQEYQELKESILKQQTNNVSDFSYKNPIESPYDTQISFSKRSKDSALYLDILPTTNTLFDNNKEYFGESHLKIANLRLAIDDTLKLDELTLFSMKTLIPYDKYSKPLSKELEISYTKNYDKELKAHHTYNHFIAIGHTLQLSEALLTYYLLGVGIGYGKSELYGYANQELGVMLYENKYSKTNLRFETAYNYFNNDTFNHTLTLNQSLYLTKSIQADIAFTEKSNQFTHDNHFLISLKYLF